MRNSLSVLLQGVRDAARGGDDWKEVLLQRREEHAADGGHAVGSLPGRELYVENERTALLSSKSGGGAGGAVFAKYAVCRISGRQRGKGKMSEEKLLGLRGI